MNLASTSVSVSPSPCGAGVTLDTAAATEEFSLLFASLGSATVEPSNSGLALALTGVTPVAADGNKLPLPLTDVAKLPLAVQQQLAQLAPADKAILAKWSALDWQEFMIQLPENSLSGLSDSLATAMAGISKMSDVQPELNTGFELGFVADCPPLSEPNLPAVEISKLDRHAKGRGQTLNQAEPSLDTLMMSSLQPALPVFTPINTNAVLGAEQLHAAGDGMSWSGSLKTIVANLPLPTNTLADNGPLQRNTDSLPLGSLSFSADPDEALPARNSLLTTAPTGEGETPNLTRSFEVKPLLRGAALQSPNGLPLTARSNNSSELAQPIIMAQSNNSGDQGQSKHAELNPNKLADVAGVPKAMADNTVLSGAEESSLASSQLTSPSSPQLVMAASTEAPTKAVVAELARLQALPVVETLSGSVARGDNSAVPVGTRIPEQPVELRVATEKREPSLETSRQVELASARLSEAARQQLSTMDAKVLAHLARLPEAAWHTATAVAVSDTTTASTVSPPINQAPDMLSLMGNWLDNRTKKTEMRVVESFNLPSQAPVTELGAEPVITTQAEVASTKTTLVGSPDLSVVMPQLAQSIKNRAGSWLAEPDQPNPASEVSLVSDNGLSLVSSVEPQKLNTTTAVATPLNPSHELRLDMRQLEWHEKFAEQLQGLRHLQLKDAEIRLDPPELGALKIQLSLQPEGTSLQIHAAVAETRHLLEQSLPKLRELFQQQGLALSQASVSSGGGQNQNAQQQSSESTGSSWSAWHEDNSNDPEPPIQPAARQATTRRGGVDHYA